MSATNPTCEVSWFSALCDDDYEFLGVPDPLLRSSWEHCRDIVMQADSLGFDNILLPSGYALGIDTTAFAAAIATLVKRIRLLMAVRIGESWPPQLARQIATIDRILGGRLTINIISSDLPGETLESAPRYRRTVEAMHILKTLLNGQPLDHDGEFWKLKLDPPAVTTVSGKCPPLYFGGSSDAGIDVAVDTVDKYLTWGEPPEQAGEKIRRVEAIAENIAEGRTLEYGIRLHVIVRETEGEAWAAAESLISRLDDATIAKAQATLKRQDSVGQSRMMALHGGSRDKLVVSPNLWAGVGLVRTGAGTALVGTPEQVAESLAADATLARATEVAFQVHSVDAPHAHVLRSIELFAQQVAPALGWR